MFLEALVTSFICGSMAIESSAKVDLAQVFGRKCVESSQTTFSGNMASQEWKAVNSTNGVFTDATTGDFWWHDSSIRNTYVRASKTGNVTLERDKVYSLEIGKSTLQSLRVYDSDTGAWRFANVSAGSLEFSRGANLNDFAVSSLKAGSLLFDHATVTDLTVATAEIGRISWQATVNEGVALQNITAGEIVARDSKFTGLSWLNSKWSSSAFSGGEIVNIYVDGSNFDKTQMDHELLRSGSISNTHMTNLIVNSGSWTGIKLAALSLESSQFNDTLFAGVTFDRVQISNTTFKNVRFEGADLRGLQLGSNVQFIGCEYDSTTQMVWSRAQAAAMGLKMR